MNTHTDRSVPASGRWTPVLSPVPLPAPPDPGPARSDPAPSTGTEATPAARRPRRLVLGISAAVGALGLGALALGLSSLGSTRTAPPAPPSAAPAVATTTTADFLAGGPCPNTVDGAVHRGNGPGGTVGAVAVIFAFQHAYYDARSGEQVRALVLPDAPVSPAATIQQGIDTIPASTAYCLTVTEHQPTHFLVEVFERRPSGETKTYRQNVTTVDRDGRTFIDSITNADR
ncbi:hypothetical protein ACWDSJ_28305 [Nocardia sp. NPDC003482]